MKLTYLSLMGIFILFSCSNSNQSQKSAEQIDEVPQVMCAPITTDIDWYESDQAAPLFDGLGDSHFPISTNNDLVQRYFNQGMVLAYGFNHAEAARSFHYASKLDPTCAMAKWGFAYVLGPNYNAGMEPDHYERAFNAIQDAKRLSQKNTTQKEQDLIQSLAKRYVKEPVDDRSELDRAYAESLAEVFERYPDDADIGCLYAESLMNLHPWDLYDHSGNARPWTPEILSTLEQVIEIDPRHCGAHHFYIHAVESSAAPEQGIPSAQLFDDDLVPNAGHLVHMSSHVYIRTGDYHLGTLSNIRAAKVDSLYTTACHAQGAYPLAYYPHNYHFLAATAALEGNSQWAIFGSDQVRAHSNVQLMKEPGWGTVQHYYTIPYYTYVKFGKWSEILEMTNDDPSIAYPEAIRNYARGMAFCNRGNLENAFEELAKLESHAADESFKEVTIWDINSTYDLLQIAKRVLKAEILKHEEHHDDAIQLLTEAIEIEDGLNYNEPPDWFFSVRHHLGPVQIAAGKYDDAITTYEDDLQRLPKNGWALSGLKKAYALKGDQANAEEVEERLKAAWVTADVELDGSLVID